MKDKKLESIYNSSIESTINKFISSANDFFLTEKDLHIYFFHSCLNENSFEYRDRLLIHTEYPLPFKVNTKEESDIIKIVEDTTRKMRPHIDSVLFNKNFINWIFNSPKSDKDKNNVIRGLENDLFSIYIKKFRETYEEFYRTFKESILSHALEFKYVRAGNEGIKGPKVGVQYDIKKLLLIAQKNNKINFPFSRKCTLLVFIGERANKKIIEELDNLKVENKELFSKFSRAKIRYSNNEERCVIRFDFEGKI